MKTFLNGFSNGLGRSLGRIVVYLVIGYFLFSLFQTNKNDIKKTISNDIKDVIQLE